MGTYQSHRAEISKYRAFQSKSFSFLFSPANQFYMQFPEHFAMKYLNELSPNNSCTATLRIKKDDWPKSSEVKVEKDEQSRVYIIDGWMEFVKKHTLGQFDSLIFEYNLDMDFDVIGHRRDKIFPKLSSPAFFFSYYPSFHVIMKEKNLGSNCYVHMPKDFAEKYYGHVYDRNHDAVTVFISCPEAEAMGAWNGKVAQLELCDDGSVKLPLGNLAGVVIHLKSDDVCVFQLVHGYLTVKIFICYA